MKCESSNGKHGTKGCSILTAYDSIVTRIVCDLGIKVNTIEEKYTHSIHILHISTYVYSILDILLCVNFERVSVTPISVYLYLPPSNLKCNISFMP